MYFMGRINRTLIPQNDLISILRSELTINDVTDSSALCLEEIRREFPTIVKISRVPEREIRLAYLLGSHARGDATRYSDIDFNFYTNNITCDIWFKYKGYLISIFAEPLDDIKNILKKASNIMWYRTLVNTSIVLMNRDHAFSKFCDLVDSSFQKHKDFSILTTEIRRIVEYRRKIHSLQCAGNTNMGKNHEDITYCYLLTEYIKNYVAVVAYLQNITVSSEKHFMAEIFYNLPQELSESFSKCTDISLPLSQRITYLDVSFQFI